MDPGFCKESAEAVNSVVGVATSLLPAPFTPRQAGCILSSGGFFESPSQLRILSPHYPCALTGQQQQWWVGSHSCSQAGREYLGGPGREEEPTRCCHWCCCSWVEWGARGSGGSPAQSAGERDSGNSGQWRG